MSELFRQSVLKKNVLRCLVFIVKRGNKSTSISTALSASSLDNMVIATTGFHCRTLQRLAPPNVSGSAWNGCAWKSASTGTSRVLMKISLQPSSGFNMLQPISGTSHEIFIPGRDEKNMKKQESVSKPATAVFNGAQLWKKKAKSGLSLEFLPAASAQVSRRSWDQRNQGMVWGTITSN